MSFLHNRNRIGVVALLSVFLGAAALVVGASSAGAAGTSRCDSGSGPPDEVYLNVTGVAFVGAHPYNGGTFTGAWICATPPDSDTAVEVYHSNPTRPGAFVWISHCQPSNGPCTAPLAGTGGEISPATTTNPPLGGAAGTGASVGTGPGTCTSVNGSPNCSLSGITVAGLTVNEADLLPAVTPFTPTPPCTGINNTCIPIGATVRIFNDTANPTLSVTTGGTGSTTNVDIAPTGHCVQVNAVC